MYTTQKGNLFKLKNLLGRTEQNSHGNPKGRPCDAA